MIEPITSCLIYSHNTYTIDMYFKDNTLDEVQEFQKYESDVNEG